MTEETLSLEGLAHEAYGWFETARRTTGDTETGPREDGDEYTRVKEGAPEWVKDLVYAGHHDGDFFPDDWRYDCIRSVCAQMADNGHDDDAPSAFADSYVDVYNSALAAWLASNTSRGQYVDEAISEFGWPADRGIFGAIALGQYMEAEEVYNDVVSYLEDRLTDQTDEEED